jgi:hypothetical protein
MWKCPKQATEIHAAIDKRPGLDNAEKGEEVLHRFEKIVHNVKGRKCQLYLPGRIGYKTGFGLVWFGTQ